MEAYQNAALSPEERAKDLLGKMTLQEKVGQLNQRLYGFRIYERQGEEFTLTEEFKEEVERMGGLGVLYGLYRADPWADKDEKTGIVLELSAKAYNIVQKYVIDHSRLGIPMMMSTECPHGHQALGGGLLPVNLAAGATFDPELLSEGYKACGKQLKSGHVDLALMSALDMARDPRWGRSEECYSEDPCLAASMAKAAVTGMQSTGVGSVAKHFCAQGETTGGVNASAARIGERELREIHFPSAKACCEAGVEGIMAAYNEIDGVYCHRNAWLLRDVLRGEMGFDGIVMADGLAVDFLKNTEGDTLHAGVAARKAGVDVSLWDEAFSRLGEAVEQGLLDESEIDESVLKVLKLKFEKGLFEHPYMEENMLTPEEAGIPEVSLSLARESAVLLKNEESVLPLAKKYKKVAVIGYHAADRYCMLGDYTPPVPESECVTVLQGMKQEAPEGVEVSYAMGSEFSEADEDEKAKALALAAKSDVIVAVVGDIVKVHIHTKAPGLVLQHGLSWGSLHDIKIDNMAEQHQHRVVGAQTEKHGLAVLSVAAGNGIASIMHQLGAAEIISGGQSMNPPVEAFIKVIEKGSAEQYIILPNNKNIILAAEQVKKLLGAAQVDYVPTTNLAQGLAALLHFDAAKTLQENSAVMRREAKEAHSAAVSIAVRDSVVNGITVKKGQYIGLLEDKIVYAGATLEEVTAETVKLAGSDWELISLYYGSDLTQSEADKIAAELEALDGGWEVTVFDGGQPLYPLLLSLE